MHHKNNNYKFSYYWNPTGYKMYL